MGTSSSKLNRSKGPNATETAPTSVQTTVHENQVLFIEDQIAIRADWNSENVCSYVRRLCGGLADSVAEQRKKQQKYSTFVPGMVQRIQARENQDVVLNREIAVLKLQLFLRRRMYRARWQYAVNELISQMKETAQLQLEQELEEATLKRFRDILVKGFTACKVNIDGKLKTIELKLVVNSEQSICYLTWTPSTKKDKAIIHMHEIKDVVPVRRAGGNHDIPDKLLEKVSYRRSFIIIAKSHHRGRMILQVSNSKERDLLLKGFKKFLYDTELATHLDDQGILRGNRRHETIGFFDGKPRTNTEVSNRANTSPKRRSTLLYIPGLDESESYESNKNNQNNPTSDESSIVRDPIATGPEALQLMSDDEDLDEDDEIARMNGSNMKNYSAVHPLEKSGSTQSRDKGLVKGGDKSASGNVGEAGIVPQPLPVLEHFYSTRFDSVQLEEHLTSMDKEKLLLEEQNLEMLFDQAMQQK